MFQKLLQDQIFILFIFQQFFQCILIIFIIFQELKRVYSVNPHILEKLAKVLNLYLKIIISKNLKQTKNNHTTSRIIIYLRIIKILTFEDL